MIQWLECGKGRCALSCSVGRKLPILVALKKTQEIRNLVALWRMKKSKDKAHANVTGEPYVGRAALTETSDPKSYGTECPLIVNEKQRP